MCDQSEYGAALGVARLAMHSDKNIQNNNIIKEITTSKDFFPSSHKSDMLMKRYQIWKDLYSTNKKIASNLISK